MRKNKECSRCLWLKKDIFIGVAAKNSLAHDDTANTTVLSDRLVFTVEIHHIM